MTDKKTAVAYYRVSTAKQGKSGLGLEAQQQSVRDYTKAKGLKVTGEFTEVETGTSKKTRPVFQEAKAKALATGSVLVIAKLDRLSRNVYFLSGLMESGVEFVACDNPQATPFTLHILSAVAEHEAKMISSRTKSALDAKKGRDGEWRVSQLTTAGKQKGSTTMKKKAVDAHSLLLVEKIKGLRAEGNGYKKIALELNRLGETTRQGKSFHAITVKRILDRLDIE